MHFPQIIFSAQLDQALGWTVIHSIWQITLIASLAAILRYLLRNKSAQIRYWVLNLALVCVLGCSAYTFQQYVAAPASEQFVEQQLPNSTKGIQSMEQGFNPDIKTLPSNESRVATGSDFLAWIQTNVTQSSDFFNQNPAIVILLWFAGLSVFLLKILNGLLNVYRLRKRQNFPADPYWVELLEGLAQKAGIRQTIQLLESALVRSPLTIGHIRPLILFPIGMINRLSEQEVAAILAHELAHIIRRDYLFNILQSLIEAIFYFHPAIWWLSRQVRIEREQACDDRAIALLGNKISYVKTLVMLQEMAFYPPQPAVAFAGNGQSQLMRRVQRLFSTKNNYNNMEKWISTILIICVVIVLSFGQHLQHNATQTKSPDKMEKVNVTSGIWEATFKNDTVWLTLSSRNGENNWNNGDTYLKSDFINLNVVNGKTSFQMIRPAGTIVFNGEIEGNGAYGRYEFTPNAAYRSSLEKSGIQDVDDELLLLCFFAGFPADYPQTVQKMGFKAITKDELQQLAAFKLDEKSIKNYQELANDLGTKQLAFDELIQLKVADVTKDKVQRLATSGFENLNVESAIQFSLQNVDPEYIATMNSLGFGTLSSDEILSAKVQGLDAGFVKGVQNMGFGKLDFDQIMSLKVQDIGADFLNKCKSLDLGELSYDDVLQIKIFEITPEMVKSYRDLNFTKLSVEDMVLAKIQHITPEFIQKARKKGKDFKTIQEYDDYKRSFEVKRHSEK